jgi:hypothetical protein
VRMDMVSAPFLCEPYELCGIDNVDKPGAGRGS